MLFYLLSPDEQNALFEGLGLRWDTALTRKNVEYYWARTSHGSTLSHVVHAGAVARVDPDWAYREWLQALYCDLDDVQGGTTSEGIHLGAMAGTLDVLERGFMGFEPRGGILHFCPSLPAPLLRLSFGLNYRGHCLRVTATAAELVVRSEPTQAPPLGIACGGQIHALASGAEIRVPLAPRAAG